MELHIDGEIISVDEIFAMHVNQNVLIIDYGKGRNPMIFDSAEDAHNVMDALSKLNVVAKK